MSALCGAIAAAVHQWFEENLDAGCEGHEANPPADCHQLAERIALDLDWPDVDR